MVTRQRYESLSNTVKKDLLRSATAGRFIKTLTK